MAKVNNSNKKISSLSWTIQNPTIIERYPPRCSPKVFFDINTLWWISVCKSDLMCIDTEGTVWPQCEVSIFIQTENEILNKTTCYYNIKATINGQNIADTPETRISDFKTVRVFIVDTKTVNWKDSVTFEVNVTYKQHEDNVFLLNTFYNQQVAKFDIASNHVNLLTEPRYSDFVFNVNETRFSVHKCILSNASPIFDKFFSSVSDVSESIINNIEPDIFGYLLKFIYAAELPENISEVSKKLYDAANSFYIRKLQSICKHEEHMNLSVCNAMETYEWAYNKFNLIDLSNEAWNIITRDILHITIVGHPILPPKEVIELINKQREEEQFKRELI